MDFFSESDVKAVVAPANADLKIASQQLGIPYIVTSLQEDGIGHADNLFHILPQPTDIVLAVKDIIQQYEWTSVALLYDETMGEIWECVHLLLALVLVSRQPNSNEYIIPW